MEVPKATPGSVYIHTQEIIFLKSAGVEIREPNIWKTIKIKDSESIYIGPDNYNPKEKTHIEFSTNAIIGLAKGSITCISLTPENQNK
nr:hypothetical protein [uncultured Pseudomonas sp.]